MNRRPALVVAALTGGLVGGSARAADELDIACFLEWASPATASRAP